MLMLVYRSFRSTTCVALAFINYLIQTYNNNVQFQETSRQNIHSAFLQSCQSSYFPTIVIFNQTRVLSISTTRFIIATLQWRHKSLLFRAQSRKVARGSVGENFEPDGICAKFRERWRRAGVCWWNFGAFQTAPVSAEALGWCEHLLHVCRFLEILNRF